MKILMDDRENLDGDEFEKLWGADVDVARLKIGDYVCEETSVCIERKTIDDFCNSIVDGRLKKQVSAMSRAYKHNFVLVSGKIGDRSGDVNEHSILGMMASLIAKSDVSILMFDNDIQLVYFMMRLFTKYEMVALIWEEILL